MLKLEWIIRLFSIFMAVLLSIILNPLNAFIFSELFFWVSLSYALLLLFKKYAYPWPLGSYYNLMIESLELMVLLYLHSASSSPMVVVLFISFLVRMALVYENKYSCPISLLTAGLFILVDFYTIDAGLKTGIWHRPIYWTVGFGFFIWTLWQARLLIEDMELKHRKMMESMGINETLIAELNESRDRLLETNDQLYTWANTDPLTNLYNVRYFNRFWDNTFEQFQQFKQNNYPISLVMIDIQGHKIYSNVYGHIAGNVLLQDLAKILRECAHVEDIVVRYSDYVFAVIIPGQQIGEAIQFYRNFKQRVTDYGRVHPGMRNIEISVGWSSCSDVFHETKEELINRAINSMRLLD
ncbi:MAG TPA: GGDEF domain-containing protein [Clostridia bacterium]|nr:GGDEF domain-containing protein [Clostridia bacterium]